MIIRTIKGAIMWKQMKIICGFLLCHFTHDLMKHGIFNDMDHILKFNLRFLLFILTAIKYLPKTLLTLISNLQKKDLNEEHDLF